MNAAELRQLAREVLTPRQLQCWELSRFHRCSYTAIAFMLDLDRSTVRLTVIRADQKLDRALRYDEGRGDVRASTLRPDRDADRAGEGASPGDPGNGRAAA